MSDFDRTVRYRLALQTAARRRGNGFTTATVGIATNGYRSAYGVHITGSGYLELAADRVGGQP